MWRWHLTLKKLSAFYELEQKQGPECINSACCVENDNVHTAFTNTQANSILHVKSLTSH